MMDHVQVLRLRSFKLHLTIPIDRRSRLPKTLTLIYLSRSKANSLEINGATISANMPAAAVLRRKRAAEVIDEFEVVYESTDRVCADDGFGFEVYIPGKKALKGTFRRRGVRWGLECEAVSLAIWAEVSVVMDGGFLMREKVKLRRQRFCPKLSAIPEEDEEEKEDEQVQEEEEEEMRESSNLNRAERKEKDSEDRAVMEGFSWAVNVGIFVACVGVGLFVSRVSLKRLVRLNLV